MNRSRSGSPSRNSRTSSQSFCMRSSSATSNWKRSWYQNLRRCSSENGPNALGCPTDSATSRSTRWGAYAARTQATAAPQSCPTTCVRSMPSSLSIATTSATLWRIAYASTSSGLSDSPNPRRSGASTRNPAAASAGVCWLNLRGVGSQEHAAARRLVDRQADPRPTPTHRRKPRQDAQHASGPGTPTARIRAAGSAPAGGGRGVVRVSRAARNWSGASGTGLSASSVGRAAEPGTAIGLPGEKSLNPRKRQDSRSAARLT